MPVRANFTPFKLLAERLADIDGMAVKVGAVGAKAAEKEEGSDLTLAELWQIHEYGTDHVPERAPLRKTFVAQREALAAVYRRVATGVFQGTLTPERALQLLGVAAATAVQKTIAGVDPPNAASTIKRKGSSTPLIDDGQLYRSVGYEVTTEGKSEAAAGALAAAAEQAA